MAKGNPIDPTATAAWVKELPHEGGAWGQGIVGTIEQCETHIGECDAKIAELQGQIDQVKAVKKNNAKLQRETAKRAEKEVSTLYANSEVERAKKAADKKAKEAAKAAAAEAAKTEGEGKADSQPSA